MGNIVKTKALVLSSIRWKESSKIVSVYGAQTGKIKIIARGAFKSNSHFAGNLESLCLVELLIDVKSSRSLQVLREIEVIDAYSRLRLDFRVFPFALAILEVINQIVDEGHADEVFFNFILEMINACIENKYPQNVFIYFLLKVSSYLGFKPDLEKCTSGNLALCDNTVFLSASQGIVFCKNCLIESVNPIKLKKDQFLYLKNLQNIHYRRISNTEYFRNDYAQLIQSLLKYINYHVEQNISVDALKLVHDQK